MDTTDMISHFYFSQVRHFHRAASICMYVCMYGCYCDMLNKLGGSFCGGDGFKTLYLHRVL